MRRVFGIVLVGAIALAIAWWIAGLPGHVEVAIGGYSIATSAPVAVLGLILLIIVLTLLVQLIIALIRVPLELARRSHRIRRASGDKAVTRLLVAIAAGDKGDARREATRARRLLGDTPQTLLLAAEAERLAGDEFGAADLYRRLASRDDAVFLGLRGLFRQAMAREDWAEAAALAQQAEEVHPGASWLREERLQLAVRTGRWSTALLLAGPDAPTVAFETAAAEAEANPAEATRLAKRAFKDNPGFVPAALVYARRLRADGRENRAQDVIRTAWKANPHPELADFALAMTPDRLARVKEAGRLVAANPNHVESHLLLARLNLDAGLTGEARRHAEAALNAGLDQRRLWILFADLEAEDRGNTEAGRAAQRDALRRAASADPDPAWRCEACGTVQTAWHPACPVCHTAGRIVWGPPRLALSAPLSGTPLPPASSPSNHVTPSEPLPFPAAPAHDPVGEARNSG